MGYGIVLLTGNETMSGDVCAKWTEGLNGGYPKEWFNKFTKRDIEWDDSDMVAAVSYFAIRCLVFDSMRYTIMLTQPSLFTIMLAPGQLKQVTNMAKRSTSSRIMSKSVDTTQNTYS